MEGNRIIRFALWMMMTFVVAFIGCAPRHGFDEMEAQSENLPPPEASAFLKYITKTDPYRNWSFYPSKQGMNPSMRRGLTPANNPHGAYMILYGNTIAIQAAKASEHEPMPYGAILIAEDYDKDKKTVLSVMFMFRVKGYNPTKGDWFWGRLGPNGEVLESGKVERCIECHRTQEGHDWRFTGAMPHH